MSLTTAPDRANAADLLAQYELLQRLGGSERASVHLARDRVLGQRVAIKLFRDEHSRDPDRIARLYALARGAAALAPQQIAAVYDHGASWHAAFITSEYIAGRDLAGVLAEGQTIEPRRAATFVAQILDALVATHEAGIIHGDLHPHNILLRGETDAIVLTDFGVGGLFPAHEGADYAPYSAPELTLTPAADIYAAGALLRALLTTGGQAAANGQGAALLAVADRALAGDLATRYPSAAAMRDALLAVTGPLTLPTAPPVAPTPVELTTAPTEVVTRVRQARQPRHSRRGAILLAGVLLLGGVAGAGALVRSAQEPAPGTPTIAAIAGGVTPTTAAAVTVPEATVAPAPTAEPASAPAVEPTVAATEPTAATAPVVAPSAPPATIAPTTTMAPTATIAPTATVAPVGFTATLSATQIEGAYRRDDGTLYGRPTVALYSVGTGYERGTLTFQAPVAPNVPLTLLLTGLDDERAAQGTFVVTINGVTVFSGPTTFPNAPTTDHGVGGTDRYWGQMRIAIPVGVLQVGANTLMLQNTTAGGRLGVPYILINTVQFAGGQ
ncbi:MAG TPA: protein kinase [Thermomicrobiales bacterium]|jgi:serine/threonine-protein kinase